MKAYFDSIEKEVPEALREVFLDRHDTAVITIDMHDGHLSTDPDCPCPSPRGREIIEPLNHFMDEARALAALYQRDEAGHPCALDASQGRRG